MAGSPGKDPVVWMRLLTLGLRLAGSYSVVPLTAEPDSATGVPAGPKPLVG